MSNLLKYLYFTLLISGVFSLYGPKSNVINLDEGNFNEKVLKSNELWLVEFFAPWCGHCKNLAPEWEKAANALKGIVNVGAVDADKYKTLAGKYNVNGFPTIKWFGTKKDNPKDYDSGRNSSDIVKYATNKIKEITQARLGEKEKSNNKDEMNNKKDEKKSTNDKDVISLNDNNFDQIIYSSKEMWLVEFYAPWCGHCKNLEPEWNKAATELLGKIKVAKVDATANTKLASRFGINGYPTIKIFPPGEKKDSLIESYDGGRTFDIIVTTALEKLEKYGFIPDIPQLINYSQFKEKCKDSLHTCILLFVPNLYDSNTKERNGYLETLKKASTVGRGKPMSFLWAQGGDFFEFEEKLGLQFGFPAVLVINMAKKKFAVMKLAFELESLKSYINRILIGRESLYDLPNNLPEFKKVEQWNGQDLDKNNISNDL